MESLVCLGLLRHMWPGFGSRQHSFHFRRLKNFPVCHLIILPNASKKKSMSVSVSFFFCQESEKPQESTFDLCSALTSLKSKGYSHSEHEQSWTNTRASVLITPPCILLHQGRQYRTRAFSATFSGPDCQGPSYFVGGSCPGLQVLPSSSTQANDFSPYFNYFSSFLHTQYSVMLFNRLIVPALSNFKACAENVGSKN